MNPAVPPGRRPYRVGAECWFIGEGSRWFRVKITARDGAHRQRVTIVPVTGKDHRRQVDWPYSAELRINMQGNGAERLRAGWILPP